MSALKVLSALFIGAGAGLAVGILMAPEKGEKTRKKLLKEVDKVTKEMSALADVEIAKLKEGYGKKFEDLTVQGKKIVDQGKKAVSMN